MPTVIDLPGFENAGTGFQQLDEGTYTFKLEKLPEEKMENEKSFLEFNWKVVVGPQQKNPDPTDGSHDPVGREQRDRVYLTGPAQWRLNRILIGMGLKARDDKTSEVAKGHITLENLLGHTIQGKLTRTLAKDGSGKEYRNVEYII